MDKQTARQVLRRVNELHFDLDLMKEKQEELQQKLALLKREDFQAGLVHADFLENAGRYVFLDDLMGR